jgi:hypothetical protein
MHITSKLLDARSDEDFQRALEELSRRSDPGARLRDEDEAATPA